DIGADHAGEEHDLGHQKEPHGQLAVRQRQTHVCLRFFFSDCVCHGIVRIPWFKVPSQGIKAKAGPATLLSSKRANSMGKYSKDTWSTLRAAALEACRMKPKAESAKARPRITAPTPKSIPA